MFVDRKQINIVLTFCHSLPTACLPPQRYTFQSCALFYNSPTHEASCPDWESIVPIMQKEAFDALSANAALCCSTPVHGTHAAGLHLRCVYMQQLNANPRRPSWLPRNVKAHTVTHAGNTALFSVEIATGLHGINEEFTSHGPPRQL